MALTNTSHSGVHALVPRMFSLLLAMGLAGVIFAYPTALMHISHGMLSLISGLLSAGFTELIL